VPHAEYLTRYRLADLFLDALPFNAGATASDALWAGLPVPTCTGEAFAARMAGSLPTAMGQPDLIADSLAAYQALALNLGTDRTRLGAIREELERHRQTAPLLDTDRLRKNLEAAYTAMRERYQRGELPRGQASRAKPSRRRRRGTVRGRGGRHRHLTFRRRPC
jgi:predicted O-linked N-acetylglucosamine transferase (SPINDLY family)